MDETWSWKTLGDLHLQSPSITPKLLCRQVNSAGDNPSVRSSDSNCVLLIHSQPRLLYEVVDDVLLHTWSFPQDIVSFCWNDTGPDEIRTNKELLQSQHQYYPSVLVATSEGNVWNIHLLCPEPSGPESASTLVPRRGSQSGLKPRIEFGSRPRTTTKVVVDTNQNIFNEPIQIDDSDEEVELWNDEDGLVDNIEKLESPTSTFVSPVTKRQRTISPASFQPVTSSGHVKSRSSPVIQVEHAKHFVGFEEGTTKLVLLGSTKLLIIRQKDTDPILWTSQTQFSVGMMIEKQVVPLGEAQIDRIIMSHALECKGKDDLSNDVLFGATQFGAIYRVQGALQSGLHNVTQRHVQRLFSLQEPIILLAIALNDHGTHKRSLVVVGTIGDIAVVDLDSTNALSSLVACDQVSLNMRIQDACLAGPYIYFLTDEHRVLRTPLSCLRSDRILNNLERLELPRLNALAPISRHHYTDFCGLYGLNCDDQVLRFGPDLSRWAQPQETSQARDKITESLNELEKLSDQANQLQTRCQLENQRIVSLNELIFELQQYALSQRDDKEDSLLDSSPAKLSLTAFSQPMITASNSEIMRYFIRLKMESALNIDWNNGWSAVVTITSRAFTLCGHQQNENQNQNQRWHRQRQYEFFSKLTGFSPRAPWTIDMDVDLQSLDLPLTITLGLQFSEQKQQQQQGYRSAKINNSGNNNNNISSSSSRAAAYFVVESLILDVIHFAEPIRDISKHSSTFLAQTLMHARHKDITAATATNTASITTPNNTFTTTTPISESNGADKKRENDGFNSRSRLFFPDFVSSSAVNGEDDIGGGDDEGCKRCVEDFRNYNRGNNNNDNSNTTVQPQLQIHLPRYSSRFRIDINEIQITQCLPALLGDSIPQDRTMAFVAQNAFRAVLYIPEGLIPRNCRRRGLSLSMPSISVSTLSQSDPEGLVWLILEEIQEASKPSTTSMTTGTATGPIVQMSIEVKGQDPRRTMLVHQAITRRIAELFD